VNFTTKIQLVSRLNLPLFGENRKIVRVYTASFDVYLSFYQNITVDKYFLTYFMEQSPS